MKFIRRIVLFAVLSSLHSVWALNRDVFDGIQRTLALLKVESRCCGLRAQEVSDVLTDCEVAYGSPVSGTPASVFVPLVDIVSNNWQEIFLRIDNYATNVVDRILIENTSYFLGEDAYLECLSHLAGKVIANEISFEELECLQANAWHNHAVASALYRRYQEPAVSNLVIKLQRAGVSTNKCQRILSGEENAHYHSLLVKGHLD